MANIPFLMENLKNRGFRVSHFHTAREAVDYLDGQIDGCSVGFGGSVTVREMELYPRLALHNNTLWHWEGAKLTDQLTTDVYITSVNGLAETGEVVNIDGTGNRVAATLFGHKRVYLIVGSNKIAPDYDAALWRARNIAAPKNARRLKKNTPCAAKADRCYDCHSPERICRGLVVLWEKPQSCETMEVVLVDQELGY